MTDYKTAYETLATAAREAGTRLGDTRWNPTGNISDWTETPEGLNHGCVTDARALLERALAQTPVGGESDPQSISDDVSQRMVDRVFGAGFVVHRVEPRSVIDPQSCQHGAVPAVHCPVEGCGRVASTWHETCTGPILWDQMDAEAAERNHCAGVVQANDMAQLPFYHENTDERPEPWEKILIRERADAAKRATEAERERCLAVEPRLGANPDSAYVSDWRERIASGEKP